MELSIYNLGFLSYQHWPLLSLRGVLGQFYSDLLPAVQRVSPVCSWVRRQLLVPTLILWRAENPPGWCKRSAARFSYKPHDRFIKLSGSAQPPWTHPRPISHPSGWQQRASMAQEKNQANGNRIHWAAFTVHAEVSTPAVPIDLHRTLRMQPSYHPLTQHHDTISDPHGHKYSTQSQMF